MNFVNGAYQRKNVHLKFNPLPLFPLQISKTSIQILSQTCAMREMNNKKQLLKSPKDHFQIFYRTFTLQMCLKTAAANQTRQSIQWIPVYTF